jgi:fatty-acyl-CoA synthase
METLPIILQGTSRTFPTGRIVPPGIEWELCILGYPVMGLWEDHKRTAEAFDPEGWVHSGDLAALDEDGYCEIVGRIKDMVIRGGKNIYPLEIEDFLRRAFCKGQIARYKIPRYIRFVNNFPITAPGKSTELPHARTDDQRAWPRWQRLHRSSPIVR